MNKKPLVFKDNLQTERGAIHQVNYLLLMNFSFSTVTDKASDKEVMLVHISNFHFKLNSK